MSKLTKFFKHPVMFFEDAQKNKKLKEGKPKIFVVGFSTWKTYLRMYFSEYDLVFLPKDIKKSQFNSQYRKKILSLKDSCQVFIWGFKAPEYILEFLREEKVSTKFVEDGFVRSVQLGATKAPPMSLCLDSKTPYFDATRPSELEDLLNNFDFSSKPELIVQAKEGIKLLLKTGVSKYNNSKSIKVEKIYGPKANKRILVLGQVEDDASIQYGCDKKLTNNDVVRLAVEENPGAQVIYKPHPDVLNGHRPYQSDPSDVENIALVLKRDIPLANAFETIDHVYTITSLGGFEALLRGIKVTTLGCPFYSGWGLTDERQSNSRRNRTLTLEQLFAVSYLVYPTYYNSTTGDRLGFDEVVWLINKSAANSASVIQAKQSAKAMSEDKKKITSSLMVNVSAGSKVNKRGFLIGFGMHKIKFYADQITEYNCWALNMPVSKQAALSVSQIMSACSPNEGDAFIIWGKKEPVGLEAQAYSLGIDVIRIEDAFIRSIGLGGHHATPLSYIYDKSGIYFDASKPSELEHILSGYDFQSNTELMEKARYTIDRMLENKTSKYNYAKDVAIEDLYGPKNKKRILVIGQVEDDASIQYGCSRKITNNDLVIMAALENPDAQIIYKPHPDVLTGLRKRLSDPSLVENVAQVLYEPVSISDALSTIDHLYTITSLTGFEALLRGIRVTTVGSPFYSGWGLTDDRQTNSRRQRRLTVEEVFAGAYILYSNYINPYTKEKIDIVKALDLLDWMKTTKVQPIDKQGLYSNSKAVIAKINKQLSDGKVEEAKDSADLAVGAYGDIDSYLARARVKVLSGELGESVKKDIKFAIEMTGWKDKRALLQYAKYLWEFEGYDKELHKATSALARHDTLTVNEAKMICAMLCDGGFYGKVEDLISKNKIGKSGLGYLSLSAYVDKSEDSFANDDKKAAVLHKKIISATHGFENYIRENSNSFCIVGNSPIEIGESQGTTIDSYDYVIRFNAYDTGHPYCKDYGSKTNVWVRMPKNMLNMDARSEDDLDLVIISGANWLSRMDDGVETFKHFVETYNQVGVVPFKVYSKLVSELHSPASAGLQILYWIYTLIGPIDKKQIFGFQLTDQSNGKDSQYNSSKNRSVRHDWNNERSLFEKIVK